MEFKDIKTADELESWYAEKEDILVHFFTFIFHLFLLFSLF